MLTFTSGLNLSHDQLVKGCLHRSMHPSQQFRPGSLQTTIVIHTGWRVRMRTSTLLMSSGREDSNITSAPVAGWRKPMVRACSA